jgi:hypothetical protein
LGTRLTQKELRAINEALSHRLADEIEDDPDRGCAVEDYETAQGKIQDRIHWKDGE